MLFYIRQKITKRIFLISFCIVLLIFLDDTQAQVKLNHLFPIEIDDKTGFIDELGEVVIKPVFDWGGNFNEGLAPVCINGKWGYIDQKGKMIIEAKFFSADSFNEGLAVVGVFFDTPDENDRVGCYAYIDKTGKYIIEPKFTSAFSFSNGLARVTHFDSTHSYINKTGEDVFISDVFTEDFFDELARFKTNGNMPDSKMGFRNKKGEVIIEPKYSFVGDFSEGLASVVGDEQEGFINTKGELIIDLKTSGLSIGHRSDFSEGLAAVYKGDKWGYIDKKGNIVIEPQFSDAQKFSEGLAGVSISKMDQQAGVESPLYYGFINKMGKLVIKAQFSKVHSFNGGMSKVQTKNNLTNSEEWCYINRHGDYVWKP